MNITVTSLVRTIRSTEARIYGQVVVIPRFFGGITVPQLLHRDKYGKRAYISFSFTIEDENQLESFGSMFKEPVVLFGVRADDIHDPAQRRIFFPAFVLEEDHTLWQLFCSANSHLFCDLPPVVKFETLVQWLNP